MASRSSAKLSSVTWPLRAGGGNKQDPITRACSEGKRSAVLVSDMGGYKPNGNSAPVALLHARLWDRRRAELRVAAPSIRNEASIGFPG